MKVPTGPLIIKMLQEILDANQLGLHKRKEILEDQRRDYANLDATELMECGQIIDAPIPRIYKRMERGAYRLGLKGIRLI